MQPGSLQSRLLTLEFYSPLVEAQFREYFHSNVRSHDVQAYWVYLVVNVIFTVSLVSSTKKGMVPTLLYTLAVLVHGAILFLFPVSVYRRYRSALVAGIRLTYLATAAYGIPQWFLSVPPATTAASLSLVIIGSGIVMTNYTALGLLVPVKQQLLLQLAAIGLYAWQLNGDTCRALQQTPVGTDCITAAWTWGSKASKFLISIYHPVPMLHIRLPRPPIYAMCLNVITFLQLVLCYLLPTAAGYMIEAAMRQTFLARHYRARNNRIPQGWHQAVASSAMLLFCWSIGLIMAWEVLCTVFIVLHRQELLAGST